MARDFETERKELQRQYKELVDPAIDNWREAVMESLDFIGKRQDRVCERLRALEEQAAMLDGRLKLLEEKQNG